MISSLLFKVEFVSAIKIVNFSVKHKSHVTPPDDIGNAFACTDQVILGSKLTFLHFHTYEESAVFCV